MLAEHADIVGALLASAAESQSRSLFVRFPSTFQITGVTEHPPLAHRNLFEFVGGHVRHVALEDFDPFEDLPRFVVLLEIVVQSAPAAAGS